MINKHGAAHEAHWLHDARRPHNAHWPFSAYSAHSYIIYYLSFLISYLSFLCLAAFDITLLRYFVITIRFAAFFHAHTQKNFLLPLPSRSKRPLQPPARSICDKKYVLCLLNMIE